jgi:hypothetical protein
VDLVKREAVSGGKLLVSSFMFHVIEIDARYLKSGTLNSQLYNDTYDGRDTLHERRATNSVGVAVRAEKFRTREGRERLGAKECASQFLDKS